MQNVSQINEKFRESAKRGFTKALLELVKGGADVDSVGASGHTALHQAAANNKGAVVTELLYELGADPNIQDLAQW